MGTQHLSVSGRSILFREERIYTTGLCLNPLESSRILTDTSVVGPDVGSMKWKLHCIPAIPGVGILVAAKRSGRIRWYKPA